MRRRVTSLFLTLALLSLVAATALAGSSGDYGTVPGRPAVGEVNWLAWLDDTVGSGGYPAEVITEDSTNAELGTDEGYQMLGGEPKWLMQVELLTGASWGDDVEILLGGLEDSSGNLWTDGFAWVISEETSDQGEASVYATERPCPTVTASSWISEERVTEWEAPAGTYHIYRSQNGSGAGNGASNGRYHYLDTVVTTGNTGVYTDYVAIESWYIVVPADSSTGAINGCHSEVGEPGPTAVRVSRFGASGRLTAWLRWVARHPLLGLRLGSAPWHYFTAD